ncbi:MAG: cytochrome c oxidase assembly protein [Thermomicrobiales bacterium]
MSLPLLHTDGAISVPVLGPWNPNPLLLTFFAVASVAYALGISEVVRKQPERPWPAWRAVAFYAGLAATALALIGPLDTYNDESFTMHMAQHLVLIQISAPLLLLGRPVQLLLRAAPYARSKAVLNSIMRRPSIRGALGALVSPIVVLGLFNLNLAAWHFPELYHAALRSDPIHELMHMSFFLTGLLFWWPIIDPVPRHHRFGTALTLTALGTAMLNGKIISGILISSPSLIYTFYQGKEGLWSMSPLTDQHLGGGLMLASGVIIYAGLFFIILVRSLLNATPETALSRRAPNTGAAYHVRRTVGQGRPDELGAEPAARPHSSPSGD